MLVGRPKLHAVGSRHFWGYSETSVAAMERRLEGRVQNSVLTHEVWPDACLTPLRRVAKGSFIGGVYSRGEYVASSRLRRGDSQFVVSEEIDRGCRAVSTVEGAAWFGGVLFDHYGHFLVESVSRLLDRRVVESQAPVVFFNPQGLPSLRPWMREVLLHLGVEPERISLCDEPRRFHELHALAPAVVARGSVNTSVRAILQKPAPTASLDLLYLSRTRLRGRQRSVRDEEGLEQLAHQRYGLVKHPQELSFVEQLRLMGSSRVVMCVEGSAAHTLMAVGGSRHVVIISSGEPTLTFLLQDELLDGTTTYVNAHPEGLPPGEDRTGWSTSPSLLTRLDAVLEHLGV